MQLLAAWDVVMLRAAAVAAAAVAAAAAATFDVLMPRAAVDVSGQLTTARAANTSSHQNGVRVRTLLATSGARWQAQRAAWCSNGSLVATQHSRGILQVRFRQPKVFGTIMTSPMHLILPGTTTTVSMCQNSLNFKFGSSVYDDGFRW